MADQGEELQHVVVEGGADRTQSFQIVVPGATVQFPSAKRFAPSLGSVPSSPQSSNMADAFDPMG